MTCQSAHLSVPGKLKKRHPSGAININDFAFWLFLQQKLVDYWMGNMMDTSIEQILLCMPSDWSRKIHLELLN